MQAIQQQTQAIQNAMHAVAESTNTMLSQVTNELVRQSSTIANLASQEAPQGPEVEQPEAEGEPPAQPAVEMDQEPSLADGVGGTCG